MTYKLFMKKVSFLLNGLWGGAIIFLAMFFTSRIVFFVAKYMLHSTTFDWGFVYPNWSKETFWINILILYVGGIVLSLFLKRVIPKSK